MTTLGQNDLDFSLYVLCTVFNINYVENRDDIKTDKKYDIWYFFKKTKKGSPASTLYKMTKGVYTGSIENTQNRIEVVAIESYILDIIPDKGSYTEIEPQDFIRKIQSCYCKVFGKVLSLCSDFQTNFNELVFAFKDLLSYACLLSQERQRQIFQASKEQCVIDYIQSFLNVNISKETENEVSSTLEQFKQRNQKISKPMTQSVSTKKTSPDGRELAGKLFKKTQNRGRFLSYKKTYDDNHIIKEIKDTIIASGTEVTLEQIVFPPSQPKSKHSVSLCGKGGSGKTHQFVTLIDGILNGFIEEHGEEIQRIQRHTEIIPLYLELNKVSVCDGNGVLHRLAEDMKISIETLELVLTNAQSNAIIFCDGMNEVTDRALREVIFDSICDIRENYHTRIVLASRDDHSGLFNSRGRGENQEFIKAEVQELSEKQINDYFATLKLDIRYKQIPSSTRKLLKTAQGLSMYAEMIQYNPGPTLKFTNLGELLQAYCDWIMKIDRDDQLTDLAFEDTLSMIAYHMVRMGTFMVKTKVLKTKDLKPFIESSALTLLLKNEKVAQILTVRDNRSLEFTHHNFRDYYAGLFLSRVIKDLTHENFKEHACLYLSNDGITTNEEILSLCADFLNLEDIQDAIDLFKREQIDNYSFNLSVLIKLYSLANRNNIASLNLDTLDLREVSLSTFKLYQGDKCVSLKHTKISEDTFLQDALQTASSTICAYTYDEKNYVTAFSTTNALIYDVGTDSWNCIRNLPNNGWVNCCCVTEINSKLYILLGRKNGIINRFNPVTNEMEAYCDLKSQSNVESILRINTDNGKSVFMFSDSSGSAYIYSEDMDKPVKMHHCNPEIVDRVKAVCKKRGLSSTARLTKSDTHAYLCFGNFIWHCDLPLTGASVFNIYISLHEDVFIKDIHYTDGILFLNKGTEISVIDCNSGTEGLPYIPDAAYGLDHFTKFSPDITDRSVIVGVAAKDNDFSNLANFYRISVAIDYEEETYKCTAQSISRGLQKLVTYTAIYFNMPNSPTPRLATVSDDRSVQILTPDDEGIPTIYHKGSYNGVHSIDMISEKELLIAQYDGSVSYWKKNSKGWHCKDVFPIHSRWVWKVQHLNGRELSFISCSYDGTVKHTNVITGKTKTLISDPSHKAILDFALTINHEGKLSAVYAITDKTIYRWNNDKEIITGHLPLETDWNEYYFRSIALIGEDCPYIAVNIKQKNESSKSIIVSWSNQSKFHKVIDIESTCKFVRCLKAYTFDKLKMLVVGGNYDDEQYFSFYMQEESSWRYKGSFAMDERIIDGHTTFITDGRTYQNNGTVDFTYSTRYGMVNDIIIPGGIVSCNGDEYFFDLLVVYKDNKMAAYHVNIKPQTTHITNEYHPCDSVEAQPMCISCINDTITIGLLNGNVVVINNSEYPVSTYFRTYANLITSVAVRLREADFSSDTQKSSFMQNFNGYFNFNL